MQARNVENDMFEQSGFESMNRQDFTKFPGMIRFGTSMNQGGILKNHRRLFEIKALRGTNHMVDAHLYFLSNAKRDASSL